MARDCSFQRNALGNHGIRAGPSVAYTHRVETGPGAANPTRTSRLELVVPLGIVGIVLMMVLPLPPIVIDFLLALSLALAIGVFLIGLFMEAPLEFSSFPAVVLVATLLRLSLNVATTRLILLEGADGEGAAGRVVETFGRIIVGGNVVVGLVVFLILVVINFVVITKGAGRVAEVAARFALDSLPGKQMAIDADLNAGNISADVARTRRTELEREMDFYGAMDGSSKFVKGDAIAGLLITGVNLVGGLLIGLSGGMSFGEAAEAFSILSVGDALVSQMPALLISTAAGVVVTRSATGQPLGRAVQTQMLGSRRATMTTAAVLGFIGLIPGMPLLPFFGLAALLGYSAYSNTPQPAASDAMLLPEAANDEPAPADEIESALSLDVLTLEVGYELVSVVDPQMGGDLVERIASLRKEIARELGIVVPPVHIKDNLHLGPSNYRLLLLGTEIAKGSTRAGKLLAIQGPTTPSHIEGEETLDPAFGTPAVWITEGDREYAEALDYVVVDHATVIATHLSESVRRHAHQILGRTELQHLLDTFNQNNPRLVDDLVPNLLSLAEVLSVLRNLLKESVSVRDLRTLLETLHELAPSTRDVEQLTEVVRQRLSRQITQAFTGQDGKIHCLVLHPDAEDVFRRSLRDINAGTGGALDPNVVGRLGRALEQCVSLIEQAGHKPCLITSPDLRRYVRAFAERRTPHLAVISFREIEPSVELIPFETVSADRPAS